MKKILLAIFSILISLIVAYLIIQGVTPQKATDDDIKQILDKNPKAIWAFDENMSFHLKTNFVGWKNATSNVLLRTNSLGMVGTNEPSQFNNILCIGDSVTFGHKVIESQTWPAQLQKLTKYNVLNVSCPGWSTWQEWIFYEKYCKNINAKYVIIHFVLNDMVRFQWMLKPGGEDLTMEPAFYTFWNKGGFKSANECVSTLGSIMYYFSTDKDLTKLVDWHDNTNIRCWNQTSFNDFLSQVLIPFITSVKQQSICILSATPSKQQLDAYISSKGEKKNIIFAPQIVLNNTCKMMNIQFVDFAQKAIDLNWNTNRYFVEASDNIHMSPEFLAIMGKEFKNHIN